MVRLGGMAWAWGIDLTTCIVPYYFSSSPQLLLRHLDFHHVVCCICRLRCLLPLALEHPLPMALPGVLTCHGLTLLPTSVPNHLSLIHPLQTFSTDALPSLKNYIQSEEHSCIECLAIGFECVWLVFRFRELLLLLFAVVTVCNEGDLIVFERFFNKEVTKQFTVLFNLINNLAASDS